MANCKKEMIQKHVKTHSERSVEDRAAVDTLRYFFKTNGKIISNFASNDKWPNTDGTFELVTDPDMSGRPEQNFFVQIKGTKNYSEKDGIVKYSLKSLAFPAFISTVVSSDPGILFVVFYPREYNKERVFWKYMSEEFLNSINFEKDSITIYFQKEDEILCSNDSIEDFVKKLVDIIDNHSFVNALERSDYSRKDLIKIIEACSEDITEYIEKSEPTAEGRDNVSKKILRRLEDLCTTAILLNAMDKADNKINFKLAWERTILDINTKYLGTFYRGLKYIGMRIPEDGQSERLMLKYYDFLWQIRQFIKVNYELSILHNLEKFPLHIDETDREFYELVANAIKDANNSPQEFSKTRFFIQKKTPFFIGKERYYEVTLQMAGAYATKYNRITAYTKQNISTNYSIQIRYSDTIIKLWGIDNKIKVITDWRVSIDVSCLNKLGKIIKLPTNISSKYIEYQRLMHILTETGLNFVDLIDLEDENFYKIIDRIYRDSKTVIYKHVLLKLRVQCSKKSNIKGHNVIRYLMLSMREEYLKDVIPTYKDKVLCEEFNLSSRCYPFDKNPFISNLVKHKSSESDQVRNLISVAGSDKIDILRPYLYIRNAIKRTGELYFEQNDVLTNDAIKEFNTNLDYWERQQGYGLNIEQGLVSIDTYESTTISILRRLIKFSQKGNGGQAEYNQSFLERYKIEFEDKLKEQAIKYAFVNSQVLLIYGAAGTGKTKLVNYISTLTGNYSKLFLTKTYTALQNLKRRIDNPGLNAEFISIDSFTKKVNLPDFDIVFVDECSTIDNRTMLQFLKKIRTDAFLVFAGDIHQIESIEFGNWFYYAKDIIRTKGSSIELLNTWRTDRQELIELWNEVRIRGALITEMLVINGPFSEDIGSNIFVKEDKDEVILCLNYDGKFGLNNMNNYFQNANASEEAISWQEWNYKVGDRILFNDTERFAILYNNLKGEIVHIEKQVDRILFTIDANILLTEKDCRNNDIEYISSLDDATRIRITIYAYDESITDDEKQKKTIIPFQLAYAVSIHKAQGLEYDSVKIVIPSTNAEKITHGIFYTAITRAKKKLKIYWSSETMQEIVNGFSEEVQKNKSLEVIKRKVLDNK